MTRYAQKTTVPVERSRNEIEATLARYGAQQFMYGWDTGGEADTNRYAAIGDAVTVNVAQWIGERLIASA